MDGSGEDILYVYVRIVQFIRSIAEGMSQVVAFWFRRGRCSQRVSRGQAV